MFYQDLAATRDDSKIRVGIVVPHYPPRIGGVERYAERLAKMLNQSERHDVFVICANTSRRTVIETQGGVTVIRMGISGTISNTPINLAWAWRLPRLLSCLDLDIVNVHSPVPFMADVVALFSTVRPVVLTYHCRSLLKGRRPTDYFLTLYERFFLPFVFRRCEGLVAVSSAAMSNSMERARLIECGVDIDEFFPAAVRRESSTILYVGRIERSSRWKGIDVLLDSVALIAREIPDVRLEVVGDGDWIPELQAHASRIGISSRVRWRGTLTGSELTAAYQEAALLVLPSVTDSELFGTVLIEAMACGTPVVASDVGGIRFTMRDFVDGLLVPPGDREALANACATILCDPTLRDRMGAAGREAAVDRWEWSELMQKMLDYIDELIRTTGP